MHTHVQKYVRMHAYARAYVCAYARAYACIRMHMHTCIRTCVRMRMHVHTHVRIVHTHVHTHDTHVHTHTKLVRMHVHTHVRTHAYACIRTRHFTYEPNKVSPVRTDHGGETIPTLYFLPLFLSLLFKTQISSL